MLLQNRVKELRARFNLTQEMLAVKVGVTRQTIAAIEKGSYTPSLLLGIKICDVFQVKVEEVFWVIEEEGER
ncbi:helix-turn-helix transcriptional regulator [Metabacillus litoralis]|uniref:Helix-turn-helix transcriptional regulator n=1 Tax=Metabacillus litoralis TaxID=152268 RepID=A0A5C6W7E6_9BACI|nr:helix-turn-helix transcriptional regulator [Metabacillus litoralis]TXC92382.1 helix-turn-helix transcriptional regulator [Metabacillus litoralis]